MNESVISCVVTDFLSPFKSCFDDDEDEEDGDESRKEGEIKREVLEKEEVRRV